MGLPLEVKVEAVVTRTHHAQALDDGLSATDRNDQGTIAVRDDQPRAELYLGRLVKSEKPAALARRIISRVEPSAVRATFS